MYQAVYYLSETKYFIPAAHIVAHNLIYKNPLFRNNYRRNILLRIPREGREERKVCFTIHKHFFLYSAPSLFRPRPLKSVPKAIKAGRDHQAERSAEMYHANQINARQKHWMNVSHFARCCFLARPPCTNGAPMKRMLLYPPD